jgi:hypothetical protein
MKVSTQTANELGLSLSDLVGARRFESYVSGRGYNAGHAIAEAEEKLKEEMDDSYILINKTTQAFRQSHPRSDFGDYNVVITGDVYSIKGLS